MKVSKVTYRVLTIAAIFYVMTLPSVRAQSLAPAPSPTSDGTSIDQGIAYVLMLLALVLTYIIHTVDGSYNF